ncbi:MAG: hypothetical protein ACOCP8_01220 [archaeon]
MKEYSLGDKHNLQRLAKDIESSSKQMQLELSKTFVLKDTLNNIVHNINRLNEQVEEEIKKL